MTIFPIRLPTKPDEPTNHLDVKARERVAAYLKKKKGFLLVSHDRRFLDGCVDHILSLNKANIEVQNENFSSWMENFERQQEFELGQNARLQKDIKRLQQSARRASSWSYKGESSKYGLQPSGLKADRGYVGHKASKMMKRAKAIEARQQQAIEQKSTLLKNLETAENLKIVPLIYHANTLVCKELYRHLQRKIISMKACLRQSFEKWTLSEYSLKKISGTFPAGRRRKC